MRSRSLAVNGVVTSTASGHGVIIRAVACADRPSRSCKTKGRISSARPSPAKQATDARTDRVLGTWIIASVAGTMVAQVAQAMEFGALSEDIAYTCHAHPTHAEAIKEAAMAVRGKPIHM